MEVSEASYELDVFDAYSYLIIGFISSVTSLLMLLAHLGWKELRRQPGDLILMISLAELGLSLHYFGSGLRSSWITSHYADDSWFCKANSYVAMAAANADVFYNTCFLIHMVISLHNSVKPAVFMPKATLHVITLGLTAFVVYKGKPGRNPYGTCSTKIELNSLKYGTIVLSGVIIFSLYVYFKTKRELKLIGAQASLLRRDFSNYQGSMILVFIVTALGIIASLQGQYQGVLAQQEEREEFWFGHSLREVLYYFGKLGNTTKVLMPSTLFVIRIRDPLIQRHIMDLLRKLGCISKHHVPENDNSSFCSVEDSLCLGEIIELNEDLWRTSTRSSRTDSSLIISKQSALKNELLTFDAEDNAWMTLLPSLLKQGLARTFLVCASYFHPSAILKNESFLLHSRVASMDNFVTFKVRETEVMSRFGLKESVSDCLVTFYYSEVFDQILANCTYKMDFRQSLSPKLNLEAIKKAGRELGGASGEMFIRSHDSKFMLKTITIEEFRVFCDIIHDYKEHLLKYPQSMIAKIFCLYSVEVHGTGKKVYAIVMENVMPFEMVRPLRTYDLKGSVYARQVLEQGSEVSESYDQVLKDVDFLNIEKKVVISSIEQRTSLIRAIKKDCNFLEKHKIIDYSLLVGVFDGEEEPHLNTAVANSLAVLEKADGSRLLFVVGIIDYFQIYNWNKSTERLLKKFKTCSPTLETSSQPPTRYRDRFLAFIEKCFTCK